MDFNQSSSFNQSFTFEQRLSESIRILQKYPSRIPIICEKNKKCKLPDLDKKKYLLEPTITIGQFIFIIRKRLQINEYDALFISINGNIPPTSAMISNCYAKYKEADGFMYIKYTSENTFG
jgi:GABA(A) receptor-associated protein